MSTVNDEPKPEEPAVNDGDEIDLVDPPEMLSEDVVVRVWREGQFARLGFSDAVCVEFAARAPSTIDPGVCTGVARGLVEAGCPFDLAERILR